MNELIDRVKQDAFATILERFELAANECESPIEVALFWAVVSNPDIIATADVSCIRLLSTCGIWQAWFVPQAQYPVGDPKYRLDFLLDLNLRGWSAATDWKARIAVECDGHDFHERTKEQAKKDRGRDRALLRDGITTVRFTGSELFQNPSACVDELISHLDAKAGEQFKKLTTAWANTPRKVESRP